MSSPCTLNKFVRWRVRDWASCFVACRFCLGEEEADRLRSSSPTRKLVFDVHEENKENTELAGQNNNNNNSKRRKEKKRASPSQSSILDRKRVNAAPVMEGESNESSWCPCHRHQDEDYIIFCFKEGGQFDIVSDHKDVQALDCFDSFPGPPPPPPPPRGHVHVKEVSCVKVADKDSESNNNTERTGKNGGDVCSSVEGDMAPNDQGWEEDGEYSEAKTPLGSRSPRDQQAEDDSENSGVVSAGSNDGSNKSDGSTGSFSFPVLPWELMGSPVQMPRAGSLQMRKSRFQCCRF